MTITALPQVSARTGIASAEDYAASREIMRAASKNYSFASSFLPPVWVSAAPTSAWPKRADRGQGKNVGVQRQVRHVQHGFADQAHLTRDFRAIAGLPPDAFRRERHDYTTLFVAGS